MIALNIFLALVACVWIMKACDPFEESADFLGRNMSNGVKGATINAVASSIPEFLTTVIFLFIYTDKAGFESGVGTTAGSAVFNAMVIPGVCIIAVILSVKNAKFDLNKKTVIRDGFFFVLSQIALIYVLSKRTITMTDGAILTAIYLIYITYMLKTNSFDSDDDDEEEDEEEEGELESPIVCFFKFKLTDMVCRGKSYTTGKALIVLFLAVAHISGACWLLAEGVVEIAKGLGMPTFFVAVVIAAAATSVPDTIISLKDAKKGNYDDAIANAIGSNIFDICICLGVPILLYCMFYGNITMNTSEADIAEIRILLLVLTFVIIALFLFPKNIGMFTGVSLVVGYLFYAVYSWCRGLNMEWTKPISEIIQSFSKNFGL